MKINNIILNKQKAFTLIELLIVLVIIGVLSGVTLRAIDMTRERTQYTDTTKKINELSKSITGDPDLISDGRQVDFGFVGDMGRLPYTLDELIKNTENHPDWNGPYVKIPFLEDTVNPSFKLDAWGNEIQYSQLLGVISSQGNGELSLTRNLADSLIFIFNNRVSGMITDIDNNPPGNYDSIIRVVMYLPNNVRRETIPNRSGYYLVTQVPIGKHRIAAIRGFGSASPETLVKWVSVVPKSNTPIDFKFTSSFRSNLQLVANSGTTMPGDSFSVRFQVFNNSGEAIQLEWLKFEEVTGSTTLFCSKITKESFPNDLWQAGSPPPPYRKGLGSTATFSPFEIDQAGIETFTLWSWKTDSAAPIADSVQMNNVTFRILFSDGSLIGPFTTRPLIP